MPSTTPTPDHRGVETQTIEPPPPGLYPHEGVIRDGIDGFDSLADEDIQFFREYGYLVIRNAFTPGEIDAALNGMVDLMAGKNPEFTGISYESQARDILDSLKPEQRQDVVRKLASFVDYDHALKALAEHPELIALLRQIIGDEPELFQDMGLIKPPRIGREKPWHQDCAYFNLPPGTQVVGVWIAFDEALIENGCMHIIPGTHKEGPVVHFQRRDWQICDTDVQINRCMAVPLQPGGCLLFDGLLHHGTPPSQSDRRRRAVQYHYKPASVAMMDDSSQRLNVFGEEGKDVSC